MRTALIVTGISLVFGLSALAQAPKPLTADEQAVMQAEEAYRLAKLNNDTAALDRVLADDFYETNQNGNTRDKAESVRLWVDFRITTLTTDTFSVRVSGGHAVVRGTQTETRGSFVDPMLFTRVYVRGANGWQLFSSMQAQNPRLAARLVQ